jgi:integrase
MPRKPRRAKHKITIIVRGNPVDVTLQPPTASRKSWYAYWTGLKTSKSTGHSDLGEAVKVAEAMLQNGGKRPLSSDLILTDEEFIKLQQEHFNRKKDPAAKKRGERSLEETEDAISAFKALSGLEYISLATPDDCAHFQRAAVLKPVNWRRNYPNGRETSETLSPNTVIKWSRSLQAAFERANKNAGKKCVRGVVSEKKLLTENPWSQFTWIEGTEKPIRHFTADELRSLIAFFAEKWPVVPVGRLAAQVLFWSCCRKLEVASLSWASLHLIREEIHFEIVGKHGVERYFRIPEQLYLELLAARLPTSEFIFAVYSQQIRLAHIGNRGCLNRIRDEFTAKNFGRWFYERIKEWRSGQPSDDTNVHVFRKTSLQLAHDGEDLGTSRKVADDAGVSESVLLGHYVNPTLWRKSNRTYYRILATLPADLAALFGYVEGERERLSRELESAKDRGDWSQVAKLAAELEKLNGERKSG